MRFFSMPSTALLEIMKLKFFVLVLNIFIAFDFVSMSHKSDLLVNPSNHNAYLLYAH
jgi:hypothetical protein